VDDNPGEVRLPAVRRTEHWEPGGLTKDRRARNQQHREARMDRLKRLGEAIGEATGLGAW
jgi:hypothetical protein